MSIILKYNRYMIELFANSTIYVYAIESHFVTDSVLLNNMNVAEPPPYK